MCRTFSDLWVVAMALAFRADPDGSAVVMTNFLRRVNTGLEVGAILLVAGTAFVTWAICQNSK